MWTITTLYGKFLLRFKGIAYKKIYFSEIRSGSLANRIIKAKANTLKLNDVIKACEYLIQIENNLKVCNTE